MDAETALLRICEAKELVYQVFTGVDCNEATAVALSEALNKLLACKRCLAEALPPSADRRIDARGTFGMSQEQLEQMRRYGAA